MTWFLSNLNKIHHSHNHKNKEKACHIHQIIKSLSWQHKINQFKVSNSQKSSLAVMWSWVDLLLNYVILWWWMGFWMLHNVALLNVECCGFPKPRSIGTVSRAWAERASSSWLGEQTHVGIGHCKSHTKYWAIWSAEISERGREMDTFHFVRFPIHTVCIRPSLIHSRAHQGGMMAVSYGPPYSNIYLIPWLLHANTMKKCFHCVRNDLMLYSIIVKLLLLNFLDSREYIQFL